MKSALILDGRLLAAFAMSLTNKGPLPDVGAFLSAVPSDVKTILVFNPDFLSSALLSNE